MRRPPAATNGIMYDDPGHQHPAGPAHPSSHWCRRATRCRRPRRRALDARGVRVVGGAQRLGDHLVGLVDGALHARRHHRLAGEAAAVTDADVDREDHGGGAVIVVGATAGSPRPSPGSRRRCRRRPVRRRPRAPPRPCRCARCRSGTRSPRPASAWPRRRGSTCRAVVAGATGRGADGSWTGRCCRCSPSCRRPCGGLGRGGGRSQDARTRSTISWGVSASRSEVVKAGLTSARASLVSSCEVRRRRRRPAR